MIWNLSSTIFLCSLKPNNCYSQIAREVLDAAARVIRPGVTTDEIDRVAHEATIAAGMLISVSFLS